MSFDVRFDDDARTLIVLPAGSPPFEGWDHEHHVFVTGDLQDPACWTTLVGRQPPFAPAVGYGLRRATLDIDGRRVLFMLESDEPHRTLLGTLLLGLSADEVARLEATLMDRDLRRRIEIEVVAGVRRVPALAHVRRC